MGAEASARVVLVVEDEAIVRAAIAEEFRSYGWHVLEAASGEHAIALVADNHIDIVFTDIQLAGIMSGWDTGGGAAGEPPRACPSSIPPAMPAIPRVRWAGACLLANPTSQASLLRRATICWRSQIVSAD